MSHPRKKKTGARLRTSTLMIGMAALFALLFVAALASSGGDKPPPIAAGTAAGPGLPLQGAILGDGSRRVGDLTVWLTAPARAPVRGQNTIQALVVNAGGQPVNDAVVYFDLDMTNMSHGRNVVQAQRVGDGRYDSDVFFMMPGPWRIIAGVERGGALVGAARFDFGVSLR